MQFMKMKNGVEIPILGFGIFQIANATERERKMDV